MKSVAIVTGGVRRLGKDISLEFLKNDFHVIAVYNSSNENVLDRFSASATKINNDFTLVKCNVSSYNDIVSCFKFIEKNFHSIDVLVNNAAVFERKDVNEIDEEFFDKTISINLKAVFFFSQFAARLMLKSKNKLPKRIINIASLGAIENWVSYIPYSISKAGVLKLTEQFAKRFAPDILVNAISPGIILVNDDPNSNVNPQEVNKYAMKRFGNSKDITDLILYLINKNNFITGQNFKVDGGRNL